MTDRERRLEFQAKLEALMGSELPPLLVEFQPPPDYKMTYPCIVYERDDTSEFFADNRVYAWAQRYQVTYIDHNPDSDVLEKLREFPLSKFNRHFATSGLNHDVFVIYY